MITLAWLSARLFLFPAKKYDLKYDLRKRKSPGIRMDSRGFVIARGGLEPAKKSTISTVECGFAGRLRLEIGRFRTVDIWAFAYRVRRKYDLKYDLTRVSYLSKKNCKFFSENP